MLQRQYGVRFYMPPNVLLPIGQEDRTTLGKDEALLTSLIAYYTFNLKLYFTVILLNPH